MYTALSAPPGSSFPAFGISLMGLPQLGDEEGAVGGEEGALRNVDEMGLSPLKAHQPGGYSFQTR